MGNKITIRRIPAVQFTYDLWRAGSLNELGIRHREWTITERRRFIRKMAIGFTEGEKLLLRRKENHIAIMFYDTNLKHFWIHLTLREFYICFPELQKY